MGLFSKLFRTTARPISDEKLNNELLYTIEYYNNAGRNNITDIKRLLKQGADASSKNSTGVTALILASEKGYLDVVNALLENGADVNATGEYGYTALMRASSKGHLDVVKVLTESGADVNAKNRGGVTALVMAYSDWEYYSDVLRLLLNHGADVNARDVEGNTTLIRASDGRGRLDVVRQMLEHGADVNAKNNSGKTALMGASFHGRLDIVKELLEHGADVNAKDSEGRSALVFTYSEAHYWLHSDGHHAVVKELLDKGADINVKDKYGKTLLMQISVLDNYKDVMVILSEKCADVNVGALLGETKRTSASDGKEVEAIIANATGNTPKENKIGGKVLYRPVQCLKCSSTFESDENKAPWWHISGNDISVDDRGGFLSGRLVCKNCGESYTYTIQNRLLTVQFLSVPYGHTGANKKEYRPVS
jgi:ankyrin repeat protein